MKRKHWIGGVLLVMALWGITGCGKAEAPPAGQMVDGPGMMYTPRPQHGAVLPAERRTRTAFAPAAVW